MVRLALSLQLCVTLCACHAVRSLNVLTAEDERRLGEEFHKQISEEAEFYDDPEVVAYVQGLTKRLAATCGRRDVEYRAHVVVSEEINAFAVPGGYLYVNVGLIRAAESESELAGVLGHEIGHVVARHGAKHMTQRLGLVALMEMVHGRDASKTAEIVGAVIAVGGQGLLLKYSREDELEADELGARNLYDSGIDPQGLARFFEKLQSASGARQSKMLRILSTHPPSEERIRKVREQIRTLPPRTGLTRDGARFRRIRGSLPTPSPEDGDA